MSWRTFVGLAIGFTLAASITGIIVNHDQSSKIHKLQKIAQIQNEWLFELGCRTTKQGQTYCSTQP